jgi:hypothetical protein
MNPSINSINQSKGNRQSCVMIEIGQSLTRVGFSGEPLPLRTIHTRRFVNQSTNQSVNQSVNQTISQLVSQIVNQSTVNVGLHGQLNNGANG